ncbi:hypothetical protein FKG94_00385 [Exilibacterium tricleocarpae]|uniref:SGNH/GDSL hydrolase family protein n=1 Tax=Exilibacterium tricleocarpae TaxID=2591008 RepID=A0A545U9A4_9GAMM|nr:SGNH/GDSL hydrolase family protein [Exilibacterium tricleocarpae]TQV86052.1 hypothetical protein FKG94_00385 [Exilibacterium tricleocarpae]
MKKYLMMLVIAIASQQVSAVPFSKMYVLGDSLSDNGNLRFYLCEAQGVPDEACTTPARFTNGAVAVEVLAGALTQAGLLADPTLEPAKFSPLGVQGTNFAVVGASAIDANADNLPGDQGFWKTVNLDDQLAALLVSQGVIEPHSGAATGHRLDPDALYIVGFAGNDVRAARGKLDPAGVELLLGPDSQPIDPFDRLAHGLIAKTAIKGAVIAIGDAVTTLIDAGARHIVVLNNADTGVIPETSVIAAVIEQAATSPRERYIARRYPAFASALSAGFNALLSYKIDIIRYTSGINVLEYDVDGLRDKAIGAGDFDNIEDACLLTTTFWFFGLEAPGFNPLGCGPAVIDRWYFYDEFHPTRNVHRLGGLDLFELVSAP